MLPCLNKSKNTPDRTSLHTHAMNVDMEYWNYS